jgi:hypothetical protein
MDTGAVSFAEVFSLLPPGENPRQVSVRGIPYILHEDHRWVLPIVHFAQEKGLLPKPCTVIMFDRHHDALDPPKLASDEIKRLHIEPDVRRVVSLCAERLKKNDDDWLKAGMELGFFGDAVILGVSDRFEAGKLRSYTDHLGGDHRIEMPALPRSALSYQGRLSDLVYQDVYRRMWKILGWEIRGAESFRFLPGLPKVLLTIDLDCFAIEWSDYMFAWPIKVFEHEFLEPSTYWSTAGWTGRSFMQELAKKSGLVTIAREHGCCGGQTDAEVILQNLIHYGFDDSFSF